MPAGLWSLTQAALLDHLDRDDPGYALRRLVADAGTHLGVPCGLLAVCAAGQPRWTAGSVPDSAVRPGTPLGGRREPFMQDGFCWLPLWRMGQPVGAWLLAGVGWVATMFVIISLFEQRSFKYVAVNCGYITVYFGLIGFVLGIWR